MSPFLDSSLMNFNSGTYLPIKSHTLYIAIRTSAYLVQRPDDKERLIKRQKGFMLSSRHLGGRSKWKFTMRQDCEILYPRIKIQGKSTMSAHRWGTCQERSLCSASTVLCCPVAPYFSCHPQPIRDEICVKEIMQDGEEKVFPIVMLMYAYVPLDRAGLGCHPQQGRQRQFWSPPMPPLSGSISQWVAWGTQKHRAIHTGARTAKILQRREL